MPANKLLDVWLKHQWARHHADALKADFDRWREAQTPRLTAWTLTQKFDAERQCIVVSLGSVELPASWMLLLGDVVSNFRACLNYLAWDLVRAGTEPKPRDRGRVKFPIVTTNRDRFAVANNICLPGVRPEHVAIIERYQPYHVAREVLMVLGPASPPIAGPPSHPLAVLQTLSNDDKHHNPQRTFPQCVGELSFNIDCVDFVSDCLEPAQPFPAVFRAGAEIATAYGRVTGPNPQAKVALKGSIAIAIEPGLWLFDAIDGIAATVAKLIGEIESIL